MTPKYYVYRNLHTGGFSIKRRGLVIDRGNSFVAENVTFKVNMGGRKRVISEKRKNVHAYAICDKYNCCELDTKNTFDKTNVITYNPYIAASFTCNGREITHAEQVLFLDGKCYLI